jgi:hypothetical protein
MELAEPRVRTGVWEHTTFRIDPVRRLRRTGLAATVTIYGARSTAEAMIARIRRMHDRITRSAPILPLPLRPLQPLLIRAELDLTRLQTRPKGPTNRLVGRCGGKGTLQVGEQAQRRVDNLWNRPPCDLDHCPTKHAICKFLVKPADGEELRGMV